MKKEKEPKLRQGGVWQINFRYNTFYSGKTLGEETFGKVKLGTHKLTDSKMKPIGYFTTLLMEFCEE